MLLSSSYDILKTLRIRLAMDDGSVKEHTIVVGDIVDVTYNKNGRKEQIHGEVKLIESGHHYWDSCQKSSYDSCAKKDWYMIVDGSSSLASLTEKIFFKCILDIDVVRSYASSSSVTSPVGCSNITDVRVSDNLFQVSQDNGKTWQTVAKVQPAGVVVVDPEDQEIADKIAGLIPSDLCPGERQKLVERLIYLFKTDEAFRKACECGCASSSTIPGVTKDPGPTTDPGTTNPWAGVEGPSY